MGEQTGSRVLLWVWSYVKARARDTAFVLLNNGKDETLFCFGESLPEAIPQSINCTLPNHLCQDCSSSPCKPMIELIVSIFSITLYI